MTHSQDCQPILDHCSVCLLNLSCDKMNGTISLEEDNINIHLSFRDFGPQSTGSMIFKSVASHKDDGGRTWQKNIVQLTADAKQKWSSSPCGSHFLTHRLGTKPLTHELVMPFYTQKLSIYCHAQTLPFGLSRVLWLNGCGVWFLKGKFQVWAPTDTQEKMQDFWSHCNYEVSVNFYYILLIIYSQSIKKHTGIQMHGRVTYGQHDSLVYY